MYIQSNHGFCVPEVGVGVGGGDGVRGGDDGRGGGGVVNSNFRQHSPFSGKTSKSDYVTTTADAVKVKVGQLRV